MVPRTARVERRSAEIPNTWTLELEAGSNAPRFEPGQFNMLYVLGVGEVPISMSGDPAGDRLVHTVRTVGAVSEALAALGPGDTLGVRGPFGSTWPVAEATGRDVVIMAGGIGLAPLRPLLYTLFAAPENYDRITLLYGTRSPGDILYPKELEAWGRHADIGITVDHATGDWHGHIGVVTSLVTPDMCDPDNTVAFLCGPEVMMRFSANALMDIGLAPESIYLSMERNMKCAVGHCGHCQLGPTFICRDGPVFRYDALAALLGTREL
jgi:NAD(P)H-flavin reductase